MNLNHLLDFLFYFELQSLESNSSVCGTIPVTLFLSKPNARLTKFLDSQ